MSRRGRVIRAVYEDGIRLQLYCCYADRDSLEAASIPDWQWGLSSSHIRIGRAPVESEPDDAGGGTKGTATRGTSSRPPLGSLGL